jgi:hypothetical protein
VEIAQCVCNNRNTREDRPKAFQRWWWQLCKLLPPGPQEVLGLLPTRNLQETPEPHWKKTNVLIVRKRDTGKMNALRKKGEPKGPPTGVMGPGLPAITPSRAHGYPSTGEQVSQILMWYWHSLFSY